jgi:hypothetical protein
MIVKVLVVVIVMMMMMIMMMMMTMSTHLCAVFETGMAAMKAELGAAKAEVARLQALVDTLAS